MAWPTFWWALLFALEPPLKMKNIFKSTRKTTELKLDLYLKAADAHLSCQQKYHCANLDPGGGQI